MKERNRASLERAIRQLPEYEPDAQNWQRIAGELEQWQQEKPLRQAVRQLPDYQPPETVWEGIATALDTPRSPRYRLWSYGRYAAAAAVLFLAVGTWLFTQREASPSVEIIYAEEWVDQPSLENDWQQDEPMFRKVEAMLSANPILQDNAEYRSLRQDLQELEEAKKAIEELMKTYGQDADLIRELGKLERARTDLVQEMVAMI